MNISQKPKKLFIEGNIDLLNSIGIDLTDEKVLSKAFDIFNEKVNELKRLESE